MPVHGRIQNDDAQVALGVAADLGFAPGAPQFFDERHRHHAVINALDEQDVLRCDQRLEIHERETVKHAAVFCQHFAGARVFRLELAAEPALEEHLSHVRGRRHHDGEIHLRLHARHQPAQHAAVTHAEHADLRRAPLLEPVDHGHDVEHALLHHAQGEHAVVAEGELAVISARRPAAHVIGQVHQRRVVATPHHEAAVPVEHQVVFHAVPVKHDHGWRVRLAVPLVEPEMHPVVELVRGLDETLEPELVDVVGSAPHRIEHGDFRHGSGVAEKRARVVQGAVFQILFQRADEKCFSAAPLFLRAHVRVRHVVQSACEQFLQHAHIIKDPKVMASFEIGGAGRRGRGHGGRRGRDMREAGLGRMDRMGRIKTGWDNKLRAGRFRVHIPGFLDKAFSIGFSCAEN